MADFYIKNDSGEFVEADNKVNELFREKSDSIVSSKLAGAKEKLTTKIRSEIEESVREEATETIKNEVKEELEAEYKPKLEDAEAKSKKFETQLRQRTIAAEYGFKLGTEEFLGEGDETEMRAKADKLRESIVNTPGAPKKETSDGFGDSFIKLTAE